MDGVMLDTEKLYVRFWCEAARSLGYPMKKEHALGIRSLARVFAIEKLQGWFGKEFNYDAVRNKRIELMDKYVGENGVEAKSGAKELLFWFKENGYYEQYYEELCRLAVEHIFVVGSVRVLRIDDKNPLLIEFADYMKKNFPDYKKNKRLDSMSRNQKMVLGLLNRKQYHLVRRMFEIKDRIS